MAGYLCDWSNVGEKIDPLLSTECSPGHYCRDGVEIKCDAGHYCPVSGLSSPIACPPGTFQHKENQLDCLPCPAGLFCAEERPITVNLTDLDDSNTAYDCPAGYYCPEGTYNKYSNPCPRGTYSTETGLANVTECQPCPEGKACESTGISSIDNLPLCAAGYYCEKGAANVVDGIECPIGNYCEAGETKRLSECPTGTYGKKAGLASAEECSPCPGGYYCQFGGLTYDDLIGNSGFRCNEGYYCNPGETSTPTDCPPGHMCPNKTMSYPIPCEIGTYQTQRNSFSCDACPPGKVCNNRGEGRPADQLEDCPAGWYCPGGSHSTCSTDDRFTDTSDCDANIFLCPVSKHCPAGSDAPQNCTDGTYALAWGQSKCDPCPPGIVCDGAEATPELPYTKCPAGHYCEAETSTNGQNQPKSCPAGTYSEEAFIGETGLKSASECSPCPGGYYCEGGSSKEPCPEGTYCQFGVRSADPNSDEPNCDNHPFPSIGGDCEKGYFCDSTQAENAVQRPCPAGTTGEDGKTCKPCTGGNYCIEKTDDGGIQCPAGYYCPDETGDYHAFPCEEGTFSSSGGLDDKRKCSSCPERKYCPYRAMDSENDLDECDAGFYCGGGSSDKRPVENGQADNDYCLPGFKCVAGSKEPTPCEAGEVCMTELTNGTTTECPEGFFCPEMSTSIESDMLCSQNNYCPVATSQEMQCGRYSYSLSDLGDQYGRGYTLETECQPCPLGSKCNDGEKSACDAGRKCEGGRAEDCPAGHKCPGTPIEQPCNMLFYQKDKGENEECLPCPKGEQCAVVTDNTDTPNSQYCYNENDDIICLETIDADYAISVGVDCDQGYYCPEGQKVPCEPGTFNENSGREIKCTACEAGFFCANYGSTDKEGQGKFFTFPNDNSTNKIL